MNRITAGVVVFIIASSAIYFGCEKNSAKIELTKKQDDTNNDQAQLPVKPNIVPPEQSGKIFGPFDIDRKRIIVTYDLGNAIAGDTLTIKDEKGISYFHETFHNDDESREYVRSAYKLEGRSGDGLIIFYHIAPNLDSCSEGFRVLGLENGLLKLRSPLITYCGHVEELPKGAQRGVLRLLDGDIIKLNVWNDFFGIHVPLKVDFQKMTIAPLMAQGVFDIDIWYTIQPIDATMSDEITFYTDHNYNSEKQPIITSEIKKAEFISAFAEVQLEQYFEITNVWLKVRVNGREVWVNDIGDFNVLGLRSWN